MPIRVIAGSAKGRRLKLVPGDSTRPIMDRVKEALFSIIGRDIIGATMLDLYAGTGSVGIEALSRGASFVLFVDIDRKAVETIRANLELTRLADRAAVRRTDALALLRGRPDRQYNYIYVAPPQYRNMWRQTLEALDAGEGWLTPETTVIVQIDPAEYEPLALRHLTLDDERRYGKTLLLFYRPDGEAEPALPNGNKDTNRGSQTT